MKIIKLKIGDETISVADALRRIKDKEHIDNQQIAIDSGLSTTTITNIMQQADWINNTSMKKIITYVKSHYKNMPVKSQLQVSTPVVKRVRNVKKANEDCLLELCENIQNLEGLGYGKLQICNILGVTNTTIARIKAISPNISLHTYNIMKQNYKNFDPAKSPVADSAPVYQIVKKKESVLTQELLRDAILHFRKFLQVPDICENLKISKSHYSRVLSGEVKNARQSLLDQVAETPMMKAWLEDKNYKPQANKQAEPITFTTLPTKEEPAEKYEVKITMDKVEEKPPVVNARLFLEEVRKLVSKDLEEVLSLEKLIEASQGTVLSQSITPQIIGRLSTIYNKSIAERKV